MADIEFTPTRDIGELTMDIFESNCKKCGLIQFSPTPIVKGRGNCLNPKAILIGEAPGPDEAVQGISFVGRAGRKLNQMLGHFIDHVWITNMVKCYPPQSKADPKKGFRAPNEFEIDWCKPRLLDELYKINGNFILMPLGNTALFGLIGKNKGISKELGIARSEKIGDKLYTIVPNYHPSYILRNNTKEKDFKEVMKLVM